MVPRAKRSEARVKRSRKLRDDICFAIVEPVPTTPGRERLFHADTILDGICEASTPVETIVAFDILTCVRRLLTARLAANSFIFTVIKVVLRRTDVFV